MQHGNLCHRLPDATKAEVSEELFASPAGASIRVERIVSGGQASPPGFWYDQEESEWVMVASGAAELEVEGEAPVRLGPGDWILLPAHRRHRVRWTDPATPTVWLAVFWR